ncbi:Hypothetical predicted protein [Mytilus galloprovincialis]|uniref:Uncharacterized protein n=1 Tax=Mytilus galloprovincialis TaxID=29158 RepID=A0A8B6ECK7_MYTGA|nr:Hypothetical predicted protein [Mytilus galloprovincialis]
MNKFLILSALVVLVSAVSKDDCHNADKCLLTVEDQNISECMDKLSVKTVDCATYSCDDKLSIKITDIQCKYDGQCVSDGVVKKNTATCATFKCETSSNVVGDVTHYKSSMVIIKRECPNPRFIFEPEAKDYFCIGVGKYRRDRENCVQYDCQSMTDADGTVTGMKVQAKHYGCKHGETCVLDGAKIDGEKKCTVQQCNVKQLNATHYSNSFELVELKCEDMNGDCHGDQETLPYKIQDKVYNCKCNISFEKKSIGYNECRSMP